jgi:hypothetical protein
MGHIKGLTNLGVAKNEAYMEPWLRQIGMFIINFGAIELVSYKYLNLFEATEGDFLNNIDKFLSKRIEKLVKERSLENKEEILCNWDNAKELAKWRNRIAHNPVLPTWKPGSDSDNSPPDLLGIPDMKQINKENKISDSISLEGLGKLNDATVEIAEALNALSEDLKNA